MCLAHLVRGQHPILKVSQQLCVQREIPQAVVAEKGDRSCTVPRPICGLPCVVTGHVFPLPTPPANTCVLPTGCSTFGTHLRSLLNLPREYRTLCVRQSCIVWRGIIFGEPRHELLYPCDVGSTCVCCTCQPVCQSVELACHMLEVEAAVLLASHQLPCLLYSSDQFCLSGACTALHKQDDQTAVAMYHDPTVFPLPFDAHHHFEAVYQGARLRSIVGVRVLPIV